MTGPSVGIYCDLGPTNGAGHLVRSASVGAALVRAGAQVHLAANLAAVPWTRELVSGYGIEPMQCDKLDEFGELSARLGWGAAVVDSYLAEAADFDGMTAPILAIDDQALRPLPAQIVVNQNLSAIDLDYGDWPARLTLRGPEFAMLRPEFMENRPRDYRERRWSGGDRNVLIVCGGTDAADVATLLTERTLNTLARVNVRVIAANPATAERIAALAAPTGSVVTAIPPTMDMAGLMNWADLAIATAGGTVWELCCLGVPMALVQVADNQREHYQAAARAGVALGLGTPAEITASKRLPSADRLGSSTTLNSLGERAWYTVDGLGAVRVAEAALTLAADIRLRPAEATDSASLLQWRNDPATRQASRNTGEVSLDQHETWLASSLANPARHLLIAEREGVAIGVLRFDELDPYRIGVAGVPCWELSITLASSQRGRGLAPQVLRAGHIWLRERHGRGLVVAETRPTNAGMLSSFSRCGYREESRDASWVTLHRPL